MTIYPSAFITDTLDNSTEFHNFLLEVFVEAIFILFAILKNKFLPSLRILKIHVPKTIKQCNYSVIYIIIYSALEYSKNIF